jgi:hypothetical protein
MYQAGDVKNRSQHYNNCSHNIYKYCRDEYGESKIITEKKNHYCMALQVLSIGNKIDLLQQNRRKNAKKSYKHRVYVNMSISNF